MSSTSEEMASQAEALQQLVAFFRTGHEETRTLRRPVSAPSATHTFVPASKGNGKSNGNGINEHHFKSF